MANELSPIFLSGPTASGKSAVALALAVELDGEIISVDSMQVYRGLDLGTAKPSPAERDLVPHHLVDQVDLTDTFDVARFLAGAREAVKAIESRGRRAIFCGGTGLYFKAWFEGLGRMPPVDPALRAELERVPLAELARELESRDPATYARIDRANPRRVVRAVEVIRLTGRPCSELRTGWRDDPATESEPPIGHCLHRQPEDLRERIHRRVDEMFERGLVMETRRLLEQGLADNRTAMQAIGYRQVVEHLRGERDLKETVALIKTKTWQFARRQVTWFRHQLPFKRIDVAPDARPEEIARQILAGGP